MNFSYNWLQSFFKRKLPAPQKLAGLLTMNFAEVEEIRKEIGDFVLNIDVRPNRASDCFSHLGIVREISAITKLNYQEQVPIIKEDKTLKANSFLKVEVKNKTACSRYTARVLTDIKVGHSPRWMRERLKACGLRSINNIVDIANYVMLETGQPLHAFDGDKIEGKKIIVRFAKKNEKIVTLDEEQYFLPPDILVIADTEKPIAIAGIKGGKSPEVSNLTKTIILESANFNPQIIRRGSKKIDLKTDASWRFEHGIDPNLTEKTINRAAYLIQKIAGGTIAQGLLDSYPKKVFPKKIKLDLNYVEKLLGIKIPRKEIITILKSLEFKVKEKGSFLMVEVPTVRIDVSIPEDLIEEIGRIYGYEKIKADFPMVSLIPPKKNLEIFWENIIKNILKEAGFTEVYNYSFISGKEAEIFNYKKQELIELENPVSLDQKYLRPSLIINLLKNLEKNIRYVDDIKLFELGKIFKTKKNKNEEIKTLAGVITGDAFYELKGVIDLLLNKLGISNIWYDEYQPKTEELKNPWWHSKKCAEIKINSEKIGFLGEVSPRLLNNFNIKSKVVYFDIPFEKLAEFVSEEHQYRPISKYPAAVRDLAILVPRKTKVVDLLNKINVAGGKLIRNIDLFDIYEGGELPQGKKNLAFSIVYQAEDRTLSSKEIDELQDKIIKTLESNSEWQVRK